MNICRVLWYLSVGVNQRIEQHVSVFVDNGQFDDFICFVTKTCGFGIDKSSIEALVAGYVVTFSTNS